MSGGGGAASVEADYSQHSGSIDGMTHDAGIKDDVGQTVGTMVSQNKQAHQESRQGIQQQGDDVKTQQTGLESHHKKEGNNFNEQYNKEISSQRDTLISDTTEKLRENALKRAKDLDDKRP